jgi:hypothetical protein
MLLLMASPTKVCVTAHKGLVSVGDHSCPLHAYMHTCMQGILPTILAALVKARAANREAFQALPPAKSSCSSSGAGLMTEGAQAGGKCAVWLTDRSDRTTGSRFWACKVYWESRDVNVFSDCQAMLQPSFVLHEGHGVQEGPASYCLS